MSTVVLADVSGVDVAAKEVIAEGRRIPYDILVLATGAQHAYFGHDDWATVCTGPEDDRRRDVSAPAYPAGLRARGGGDRRRRAARGCLTFVVVGGGPTGVEMAGAIAELAKWALAADFRNIDPRSARIVLIEGGPRLLAALHPDAVGEGAASLEKLGVEVRLNAMVTACSDRGCRASGRTHRDAHDHVGGRRGSIARGGLAWCAGGSRRAREGRSLICRCRNIRTSSCIGDTALALDARRQATAGRRAGRQAAGRSIWRSFWSRARSGKTLPPFRYRDFGSLATIGRKHAVADFGKVRLSGFVAWVLWSVAHIYFLIGFRRRTIVALHWAWSYITFQRGTRLITGLTGSRHAQDTA